MQASLHYRQLIAPLPIPTVEQTESFAVHVAGAHSWYKHLPYEPPGIPFVVFLDPNAGRKLGSARVTAPDGASIAISPEVVAAGTVYLTAHVHESFGHVQGADSLAEAEHARQCAELRVALHRVRSLLTRGI
jgi:hypothetical protein